MKYPICYIYKRTSDKGRELRYSLRSLDNLTDWNGEVYIIGHKEYWVQGVTHIEAPKFPTRHQDVQSKYLTIATHKQIPDDFILMMDDIYITKPTKYRTYHQGDFEYTVNSKWIRTKYRTRDYLIEQGIKEPKDYDIHVPILMNKQKLLEVLKHHEGRGDNDQLMTRSLYGNLYSIGGEYLKDPKTKTQRLPRSEIVSTHMFIDQLKELFIEPSRFERI